MPLRILMTNRRWHVCIILCVILTSFVSLISTVNTGGSIDIDISSYNESVKNTHIFKRYDVLNEQAEINVNRVPQDVGFFVIQVNTYGDSVVLSNTSDFNSGINGTNVGYVRNVDSNESYKFYLWGKKNINTTVFVVVVAYTKKDPVPGACNSSGNVGLIPYQKVSYNDYLIQVSFQAALVDGRTCQENAVKLELYHMFLEEWDLSSGGYFSSINKMLTVDDITKYGTKVPESENYPPWIRYFNAYRGTGSIFAIIARHGNVSSSYIPALSYACDIKQGAESCYGPVTIYWKIMCGLMVFFGLFMCFLGHRFFNLTLFFIGFLVAAALTYIVTSYTNLDFGENLITLGVIGALYGAFWVILWCKFGIPLLSVTLSFAVAGYLVSSIFFYIGLADVPVFRSDINYWSVVVGILLLVTLVLLILSTFNSNIFATSFLGSYMFIIPLDHYIGGNLRYIFLNTLHRAIVPDYNQAVIDPPFQTNDQNLVIFWALLMLAGIYAQWRQNRGRAPFPPPIALNVRNSRSTSFSPNDTRNMGNTERTPLISADRTPLIAVMQRVPARYRSA